MLIYSCTNFSLVETVITGEIIDSVNLKRMKMFDSGEYEKKEAVFSYSY